MEPIDQRFMRQAIELARRAEAAGEVPVGAVLVRDAAVIARGWNRPVAECDPTAHAEIEVLRAAGRALGNYRLTGTTVYVTKEPCSMCAGALVHARVRRLVFGVADERAGAAGSVFDLLGSPGLNHRIQVVAGILEEECRNLLQCFFRRKRG
jgi:tRNA(adenine34) deaminase